MRDEARRSIKKVVELSSTMCSGNGNGLKEKDLKDIS